MTLRDILITAVEIIMVGVTLWSLFHEDKFVAFEEKIKAHIRRRRLRVVRNTRAEIRLAENR